MIQFCSSTAGSTRPLKRKGRNYHANDLGRGSGIYRLAVGNSNADFHYRRRLLPVRSVGLLAVHQTWFYPENTIGKAFGQKTEQGKFSSFQAVTGALAFTLGAGNIIGTAMAIAYSGPGGVFWLWLSGLVCCCVKYSKVTLAIKYRRLNEKDQWEGTYRAGRTGRNRR